MTTLLAKYATDPPLCLSATDFRSYCVLVWVLVVGFYVKRFDSERRFLFGAGIRLGELIFPELLSASGQTLRLIVATASNWVAKVIMTKKMTMGAIVGNRRFFPDHLAKSGREENWHERPDGAC